VQKKPEKREAELKMLEGQSNVKATPPSPDDLLSAENFYKILYL